jgi:hypothetical protein
MALNTVGATVDKMGLATKVLGGDLASCRAGTILPGWYTNAGWGEDGGELCATGRIACGRGIPRNVEPEKGSSVDFATGGRCVFLRIRDLSASGSSSIGIQLCRGGGRRWGDGGPLPITTRPLSSSEEPSPDFGILMRLGFLCTLLLPNLSLRISDMRRFGALSEPSPRLSKLKTLKPLSCGEVPIEERAWGDISGVAIA